MHGEPSGYRATKTKPLHGKRRTGWHFVFVGASDDHRAGAPKLLF
jgi:hypothetical protein